jgi:tetrahydromethanopterin S-methyltransferase subunit B
MTANNFAKHLDGYISRILSGLKPSKPELRSFSCRKDTFGVFETMKCAIIRISPLFMRDEANV